MEFIKKNWFKLCIGIIAVAALVFNVCQYINLGTAEVEELEAWLAVIGYTLAIVGVLACVILGFMDKKKLGGIVLAIAGALAFIALMVSLFMAMPEDTGINGQKVIGQICASIVIAIALGLIPAIIGLKRAELLLKGKISKIVIGAVAGVGLVLSLVAAFSFEKIPTTIPDYYKNYINGSMLMYIGIALVFAAMLINIVCKLLNKNAIGAYIFVGLAVIGAILVIVGLCMGLEFINEMKTGYEAMLSNPLTEKMAEVAIAGIDYMVVTNLITVCVFALAPLAFSAKKLCRVLGKKAA